MDDWVVVARFDEMSEAVQKEEDRIKDIALDLGLMPEQVIRTEQKDKVEILIHPEFYTYFEG
ncbi:MAG: hypothetical protein ACLFP9_03720 [Desulfonatronovibrio sp.]